jgi:hypothetical protein
MSGLPALRPVRRLDLMRFDLRAGLPTAVAVLRRALGAAQTLRALVFFAVRSVVADPLRKLSTAGWPPAQEALVRHQLRPVVILHDVLRHDLKLETSRALVVLGEVVRMSGARFIEHNVPQIPREAWRGADEAARRSFVQRLTQRLFNAQIDDITTSPTQLAFKVHACRFVQLTHELGRPELAPLFCAADAQFFDAPSSPRLDRPSTIAADGHTCHFVFSYKDPDI